MTNKEAIELLKYNSNVIHVTKDGISDPREVDALDMAIKALEWQDDVLKEYDHLVNDSDKDPIEISKDIDKFCIETLRGFMIDYYCDKLEGGDQMVKEKMYEDFIKYAKEQFDVNVNVVKSDDPDTFEKIFGQTFCEDTISRREVLRIVDDMLLGELDHKKKAYEEIKQLPSVYSKPKTGQWKGFTHSAYHGNDEYGEPICRNVVVYHCSLCKRRTVIKENYCPNCGAKMEETK